MQIKPLKQAVSVIILESIETKSGTYMLLAVCDILQWWHMQLG